MNSLKPITYRGKTLTLKQWGTELGLQYNTIRLRAKRGLAPKDILKSN